MAPNEWSVVRLSTIIRQHNEKSTVPDQYEVFTSSRNGLFRQSEYYGENRLTARENIGFNVLPKGYLTYRSRSDDGAFYFNQNTLGKSGLISIYYPAFIFEGCDQKYMLALLNSNPLRFYPYAVGTSQKVLSINALGEIQLKIPPLPEQKKIAAILSTWDDSIAANEDLLANSRLRKKALMQQLLTGKKRLKGFEGEWSRNDLKNISKFYRGRQLSKDDLDETGCYPAIHYGELFTKYSEVITKVVSRTNKIEGQFLSTAKDVLMPTSDVTPNGLARASAINKEGVVIGGDVMVIRINEEHSPNFFSYLLNYSKREILRVATGTTVFHIYGSDIGKLKLAFPSYKEQCAIVEVLTTADEEIEALEQRINNLKLQKKALMQQLLTGKKRVKVEPVTA